MFVIETNKLSKSYHKEQVLKNVSLTINQGEFVSIVGPSGSGKSTLLYLLNGLEKPTSGTVLIDGDDINAISEKRRDYLRCNKMGFVFQFFNLVPNLTVEENIMAPAVMTGKKICNFHSELEEIIDVVGLLSKRKAFPSELSGGQQQRVSIARALINKPKIIFADEPTGNLDSKTGQSIMNLLKQINADNKTTIVQVTHNDGMSQAGNRIISIIDGQIRNI